MGRSWNLDDELDALLDGHDRVAPAELAPLVGVATALRDDLDRIDLDPLVAADHLELVLGSPTALRPGQRRPRPRWRRAAAAVLAAAMLAGPAGMASAGSLPGDPLYGLKLAVEQARLVAARSPLDEARTRARIASDRLAEVEALLAAGRTDRLAGAVRGLDAALRAADLALARADRAGADPTQVTALADLLRWLRDERARQLAGAARTAARTSPRLGAAAPRPGQGRPTPAAERAEAAAQSAGARRTAAAPTSSGAEPTTSSTAGKDGKAAAKDGKTVPTLPVTAPSLTPPPTTLDDGQDGDHPAGG